MRAIEELAKFRRVRDDKMVNLISCDGRFPFVDAIGAFGQDTAVKMALIHDGAFKGPKSDIPRCILSALVSELHVPKVTVESNSRYLTLFNKYCGNQGVYVGRRESTMSLYRPPECLAPLLSPYIPTRLCV